MAVEQREAYTLGYLKGRWNCTICSKRLRTFPCWKNELLGTVQAVKPRRLPVVTVLYAVPCANNFVAPMNENTTAFGVP